MRPIKPLTLAIFVAGALLLLSGGKGCGIVPVVPTADAVVPKVIGLPYPQAKSALLSAGLKAELVDGSEADPVYNQSPNADEVVPAATVVRLQTKAAVIEGPRDVLIVHETATDGPAFARLKSNLRSGVAYDYLKSKGHTLLIQDPDDGSPVIKQWQAELTGLRLPAIIISAKGKLLFKQSLSDAADVDEVMNFIKTQEAK